MATPDPQPDRDTGPRPLDYADANAEAFDVVDENDDGFGTNPFPHAPIILGVLAVLTVALIVAFGVIALLRDSD